MDFFKSNNVQPQKKSLNIMYGLIVVTSLLVVSILVYGVVKYFDYQNLKRVVCDENKKLEENIDIINSNNELLKNKKTQFSDHLSNNYEDTSCEGEWNECDNDCKQVYSVNQPKNGEGEDCEFSDGQVRDCVDEGDCSPVDCAGNCAGEPIDDLDPLVRPIRALDSLLQYGFQIALRTLPVFGENNHSAIIPLRGRA